MASVPLAAAQGESFGALTVVTATAGEPTARQRDVLRAVASWAAGRLRHAGQPSVLPQPRGAKDAAQPPPGVPDAPEPPGTPGPSAETGFRQAFSANQVGAWIWYIAPGVLHLDEPTMLLLGIDALPATWHVSLDVHAGDATGIVGESGSGKSSLARALVGAVAPSSGEVLIDGRPWNEVSGKDVRRRDVQMVFQDPYGSLNPRRTALETVAEVLRVARGKPASVANREAANLLREVGLPTDTFGRRAQGLSGGQCQRVGIARALACEPKVLIADEPTSALDVSVQAQILNLLSDLREHRGLALVLISHDLGVIHYATRTTHVMHSGRVVESGDTDAIFERPAHHYTLALLASLPENGGAKLAARDIDSQGLQLRYAQPGHDAGMPGRAAAAGDD
jgi:ABC-type dipeptide/oligopeptide/nickel transport system ATPase subunit